MSEKKKRERIFPNEQYMFCHFMNWFGNLSNDEEADGDSNKPKPEFKYEDPAFQSFLKDNGISICSKNKIPQRIKDENSIIMRYKPNAKPDVRSLARHIRNAIAHANITKINGVFCIFDKKKTDNKDGNQTSKGYVCTMRGRINADLMPDFLQAIKDNYRIRGKRRTKQKTKATAVAEL